VVFIIHIKIISFSFLYVICIMKVFLKVIHLQMRNYCNPLLLEMIVNIIPVWALGFAVLNNLNYFNKIQVALCPDGAANFELLRCHYVGS
jgi:hypothetical protein